MRRMLGWNAAASDAGDYTTYGLSGFRDPDALRALRKDIEREQGGAAAESDPEERFTAAILRDVEACRDQEKAHARWLEEYIRKLGGDPERMTEMAKLSTRESRGIDAVIMKDAELPHLFHALLAAEHLDAAGWDLLVALADDAGDRDTRDEFEKRLREEEQHLSFVREALRTFAAHAILGQDFRSPTLGAPPAH
ncbi:DUF892 family protein [Anaeromyxobacter terrae]|uniref:DUF892 family protein n=1 Tax=Anaeromyxobacter terrae TaxID=2925406 RepID=UPI001F56E48F|nr:DUF892 family protein [Anaeromyxobacter sp. SG22]